MAKYLSVKNKKGSFRFNGQTLSTDDRKILALICVKGMTDAGKKSVLEGSQDLSLRSQLAWYI